MRIENGTRWSTSHIERIAREVVRREGLEGDADRLVFVVQTTPDRRLPQAIGIASVGSIAQERCRVLIVMPSVPSRAGNGDPVVLAHTIAHELAHCRGLEHEDMEGRPEYAYCADWRSHYAWAALLPLAWIPTFRRTQPPLHLDGVRYA